MEWLIKNQFYGIDDASVHFKESPGSGLGCFASKDFDIGDLIFRIPQDCIISIRDAISTPSGTMLKSIASQYGQSKRLSAELMIWIFMCEQLYQQGSHFGPYLRSLDQTNFPSVALWPHNLKESLAGTNIVASIDHVDQNLKDKIAFIDEINRLSDSTVESLRSIDIQTLSWAFSHYVSR